MTATDNKTDRKVGRRGEYGHAIKMSPFGKIRERPNRSDKRDFNKRSRRAAKLSLREAF